MYLKFIILNLYITFFNICIHNYEYLTISYNLTYTRLTPRTIPSFHPMNMQADVFISVGRVSQLTRKIWILNIFKYLPHINLHLIM